MTATYKSVGVLYCITHEGVANEDDQVCDYVFGDIEPCVFRRCFIQKRTKVRKGKNEQ